MPLWVVWSGSPSVCLVLASNRDFRVTLLPVCTPSPTTALYLNRTTLYNRHRWVDSPMFLMPRTRCQTKTHGRLANLVRQQKTLKPRVTFAMMMTTTLLSPSYLATPLFLDTSPPREVTLIIHVGTARVAPPSTPPQSLLVRDKLVRRRAETWPLSVLPANLSRVWTLTPCPSSVSNSFIAYFFPTFPSPSRPC